MSSEHTLNRRRRILVDRRSQLSLSLTMAFYLVIYGLLMFIVILAPSALTFMKENLPVQVRFEASREFLAIAKVVPWIILFMVAAAVHFLTITHRIFGPLLRFQRVLKEWAAGGWPGAFHCRPKDFNEDVFAAFNLGSARVGEDLSFVRERLRQGLEVSVASGVAAAGEASRLAELESRCREALECLDAYRLP